MEWKLDVWEVEDNLGGDEIEEIVTRTYIIKNYDKKKFQCEKRDDPNPVISTS